ncbi:MAG: hypothetical protein ACKOXO_10515 [Cyanobium sp.]
MFEKLGAELVPGGTIEIFYVRFFVVAAQHSKQCEATESPEGFDVRALIAQHLEQQAEVVGEGRLLGQQKQQPGLESLFRGLLEIEAPADFLED